MWQSLADNYAASKMSIDAMQSILSDHGLLDKVGFMPDEVNTFLFGDHDYVMDDPIRDWNTVYQDLVDAGINNRSRTDLNDNLVNWVLDGKIINLEPAEPPVL